jgi:hypothetical protein
MSVDTIRCFGDSQFQLGFASKPVDYKLRQAGRVSEGLHQPCNILFFEGLSKDTFESDSNINCVQIESLKPIQIDQMHCTLTDTTCRHLPPNGCQLEEHEMGCLRLGMR